MLKALKGATLRVAHKAGIAGTLRKSRWRQSRLLVLGYHGVALSDEHEWDPALYIEPSRLRRRFEMLRDGGYNVLPLDESVRRLREGTLPPKAVSLTFDDGTRDFALSAVPLLREFGFPATLYLTTFYCVHQRPVFTTMCRYMLWMARSGALETSRVGLPEHVVSLESPKARASMVDTITRFVQQHRLSWSAKDEFLERLAGALGLDWADLCARRVMFLLSPDEVAGLPNDLIDVQLHTHRHRVPLDRLGFLRELTENGDTIRALRPSAAVRHFCYPSGFTHPMVLPWLRECGILSATTCEAGLCSRKDDPLMLPRLIDTNQLTTIDFSSWLDGVGSLLPRRPTRRVTLY